MSLLASDPGPPTDRSRLPLLLAALLVLGGLAGGAWLLLGGARPSAAPGAAAAPEPGATTGSLRVTADAEGAVVMLDGRRLGLVPHSEPGLEPGAHHLRVERFGREPFETDVRIRAGEEARVHAEMSLTDAGRAEARRGELPALRVVSDVPGASVFLDREFLGKTPVEIAELSPGPHRLNVSAEGYEMYAEDLSGSDPPREISVGFKEVRLHQSVAVRHKRTFGSRAGTLSASPDGLRFESEDPEDSFQVAFRDLERFEMEYLKDNLKVKIRGGRTYNFTSQSDDPDELFVFHREVERVRERLTAGAAP